jgi:fumarate hydratase subunit beta
LRVDDHVLLTGEIVITAGLPTHDRILEYIHAGKPLPVDLTNAAFFHLGSYSQEENGVFDVLYMNPTTSTRFNGYMPTFIRSLKLRAVGGKAGSMTRARRRCRRSAASISRSSAAAPRSSRKPSRRSSRVLG